MPETRKRTKIAAPVSGNGSTLEAVVEASQDGRLNADVGLVVCNNTRAKAGVYGRVAFLNRDMDWISVFSTLVARIIRLGVLNAAKHSKSQQLSPSWFVKAGSIMWHSWAT